MVTLNGKDHYLGKWNTKTSKAEYNRLIGEWLTTDTCLTISAPLRMSLDTIRVFAISKLGWIRQQQRKLLEQERESPREYLNRESHYVWFIRYFREKPLES